MCEQWNKGELWRHSAPLLIPQDLVFREQSDICCPAVDIIEELFRCDPTVCCSISVLLKHTIPRFLRLTDAGVSEKENYSNIRLWFYFLIFLFILFSSLTMITVQFI